MTASLRWREAERGDRPLLQGFCCTVPVPKCGRGRPLPHPYPWEREVEVGFRTQQPPVHGGEALLLGEDDEGLAAAVLVRFSEGGRLAKIEGVAVDRRCQGSDLRPADQAIERALRAAADYGHGSGHAAVLVQALIHPENVRSRAVFQRVGFRCIDPESDGGYELWMISVELPPEMVERA